MKIYQIKPGILSYTPEKEGQKPMRSTQVATAVLAKFLDKEFDTKIYTALEKALHKRLAYFNTQLILFDIATDGGLEVKGNDSGDTK